MFNSAAAFQWPKCRPEIEKEVDYLSLIQYLIYFSVEIDLDNSPDSNLSASCQIFSSVPSTWLPKSSGKEYYTDNNLSSEVVSVSVLRSF